MKTARAAPATALITGVSPSSSTKRKICASITSASPKRHWRKYQDFWATGDLTALTALVQATNASHRGATILPNCHTTERAIISREDNEEASDSAFRSSSSEVARHYRAMRDCR